MFNISCWFVIVYTLNLVPERFKYVTAKCVCQRYPPLTTSSLIAIHRAGYPTGSYIHFSMCRGQIYLIDGFKHYLLVRKEGILKGLNS